MFRFGTGSLNHLRDGVPNLQQVCHGAIGITKIDFGVIDVWRTMEEQEENVRKGVSQTLDSKHLIGHAIDFIAYYKGKPTWNSVWFDEVADAFRIAGIVHSISLRWGGAWHIPDITKYCGSMEEATQEYIELRISQGRKPFLDYGHIELA